MLISIDTHLVQRLIADQFPQWKDLDIKPVEFSGWDNRTFHLGEHMTVRLPSSEDYAKSVEREQYWLPKLAPHLPLPIPTPLAMGKPSKEYPWAWSVYKWIDGDTASIERIKDQNQFATDLAGFLKSFQSCDTTDGPLAGPESFYRGGDLAVYDVETRSALASLTGHKDIKIITEVWDAALSSKWQNPPVWVHGDMAVGNLLIKNGRLSAIIDFGQLCIGDPACDLATAWTLFTKESRDAFRTALPLDNDTWARGRGWVLWKALCWASSESGGTDWRVVNEVLNDYRR